MPISNKRGNAGILVALVAGFALLFIIGYSEFGLKGLSGFAVLGNNSSACGANVDDAFRIAGL